MWQRVAIHRRERFIEVLQPAAGEDAFGRDMSKPVSQMSDHGILACRTGGHGRMAAFARKHDMSAGVRDVDRHAKPGAGANRHERRSRDRLSRTDRPQLVGGDPRQRPCHPFEIIDETRGGISVSRGEFRGIDHPAAVGQEATTVLDRAGNGDDRGVDGAGIGEAAEIGVQRRMEGCVILDGEMGDHADLAAVQDCEARIGSADI